MADWGDTGFYSPVGRLWWDAGFGYAAGLGSIVSTAVRYGSNIFTDRKRQSVIIALPGASPNEVVTLTKNGQLVEITAAQSTTAYFYDLEDGTYIATDINSGATWKAVVLGQSVTVTQLNTTGGGNQRPTLGQLFPLGMIYGAATMAGQSFAGQAFTASGSWTVPAGINAFKYRVWGDGGGGGGCPNSSYSGGGGGGGGGFAEGWHACSPGDVFTVAVGPGGAGGNGVNGTAGSGSSITGPAAFNVSCGGGQGGNASSGTLAVSGGAGGAATGGTLNLSGSYGQNGYYNGGNSFAGNGGGSFGSPYGSGGTSPGSGGGGGANTFRSGANGAPGLIIIEW